MLQAVRQVMRRASPDAEEVISYQIPAYQQAGILKGNLRFPYSQPIPYELIERITRLRVQQNLAKASAKVASKKAAKSHGQAK